MQAPGTWAGSRSFQWRSGLPCMSRYELVYGWEAHFINKWGDLIKVNAYDNIGIKSCFICWRGVTATISICPYCTICSHCLSRIIEYFARHKVYCSN